MKAQDLYAMTPEYTILSSHMLKWHVPEINFYRADPNGDRNTRVSIRVIREVNFDHRRFWRLATVWLDDQPVMVIQNAGREGDDHYDRFVTNGAAYVRMVEYLRTLEIPEDVDIPRLVDPAQDLPALTGFYGYRL
jgi:hypothetical protein